MYSFIGQILFHIGNKSMKMRTSQDLGLCNAKILSIGERCLKTHSVLKKTNRNDKKLCVGLGPICYLSCLDSCLQTYVLRKIMLCLS